MRRLVCAALLGAALAGCEAKTVINDKPMTDEEKAKVKAEDERIADEESQGSVGKVKPKTGRR